MNFWELAIKNLGIDNYDDMTVILSIFTIIGLIITLITGYGLRYPGLFNITDWYSKSIIKSILIFSSILTSICFSLLIYGIFEK